MTKRERVRTAMDREPPDRVPKTAGFTPSIRRKFEENTGHDNPAAYFDYDVAGVGFSAAEGSPDPSAYFSEGLPEGTSINEYGGARIPGDFKHFTRLAYPMRDAETIEEFQEYPWPDFTPECRHEHLEERVTELHEQGWYVTGQVGHIWETAWQITSMENLMTFFIDKPEIAKLILSKITDDAQFKAKRLAQAGCDCIHCGDDVGMQEGLMMHPDMWRDWLKPCWERVWETVQEINPDAQIFYHSDGDIRDIIPDLIDMGLNILNPVQPECMDPAVIKRKYGDRLAFWGCVGTQTTFPFGTPDDVTDTVKNLIETVGAGGGLLLAPTHVLEPEVPWENIVAFFEAVDEYGRY